MSALAQTPLSPRIECEPAAKCAVCGGDGSLLYSNVRDYLFGVGGSWNIRRCVDEGCGLLWIDPLPLRSEIAKAYQTYYTHADTHSKGSSHGRVRQLSYRLYDLTVRLVGLHRQRRELMYMFLQRAKPGRLLEVGCGNGARLALFRDAGWVVEGVEVDTEAAKWALAKHCVLVRNGELPDLQYQDELFDAVIMNHVLEHVHDPRALVAECFRLLRPGGTFVSITPNSNSFGHAHFTQHWIGLDPPRHLHIFNKSSLLRLVEGIPACRQEVWTSAANAELICGWSLRTQREHSRRHRLLQIPRMVAIACLQYAAVFAHAIRPLSGEECVLRLTK